MTANICRASAARRFQPNLTATLLAATLAPAQAQQVIGPRIDLRIEQPAYAGMPIWLDVDVQDGCLEARYPGAPPGFFGIRGDRAEVTLDGRNAPPARFPPAPIVWIGPGPPRRACPGSHPVGPASQHRFPLHLVASIDRPGAYAVRWVVPGEVGIAAQSAWLPFTVQAFTRTQREAWLKGMVSHPPADPALLAEYISSLLVAWPDPRITHTLLNLLCAPDKRTNGIASGALTYKIGQGGDAHLVTLVANGCLTPAVVSFLSWHNPGSEPEREQLLRAAALHLQATAGPGIVTALEAMYWLRPRRTADDPRLRAWADQQVLRVAPSIIAGNDDAAKQALVSYLGNPPMSLTVRKMLHALAEQHGSAAMSALGAIASLGDPADLPWLTAGLAQPTTRDTDGNVLGGVAKVFGKHSIPLLRAVMSRSSVWTIRDHAAIELARFRETDGIQGVIDALRSSREAEPGYVLSDLEGFHIPSRPDSNGRISYLTENSKRDAIEYFERMLTR
jgi:hypothetical protein